MKALIVEDDYTSRLLLHGLLKSHGEVHGVVNGKDAVSAFRKALDDRKPYDLICMDIMMPEMDGQDTLREIRRVEGEHGILVPHGAKVIMTTALRDKDNVLLAFRELCDAYLVKPISKEKLLHHLRSFDLIS